MPSTALVPDLGNTLTRRMLLIGISVKTPVGTGATPGLGGGTAAAGAYGKGKMLLVTVAQS